MTTNIASLSWLGALILSLLFVNFSAGFGWAQPEAQTEIRYLSGGIGLEERDALRAAAKDYNLELSFAEKDGNYLSDVEVMITDAQGKALLETISKGPWFFAQLPAGKYTVRATKMGKTNQQAADVKAGGQTQLHFYW